MRRLQPLRHLQETHRLSTQATRRLQRLAQSRAPHQHSAQLQRPHPLSGKVPLVPHPRSPPPPLVELRRPPILRFLHQQRDRQRVSTQVPVEPRSAHHLLSERVRARLRRLRLAQRVAVHLPLALLLLHKARMARRLASAKVQRSELPRNLRKAHLATHREDPHSGRSLSEGPAVELQHSEPVRPEQPGVQIPTTLLHRRKRICQKRC